MFQIQWTEEEKEIIREHGEVCYVVAREAMIRSELSFDDIERINGHSESHRWGSNADRRYRERAVRKAIEKVAANAADYL